MDEYNFEEDLKDEEFLQYILKHSITNFSNTIVEEIRNTNVSFKNIDELDEFLINAGLKEKIRTLIGVDAYVIMLTDTYKKLI